MHLMGESARPIDGGQDPRAFGDNREPLGLLHGRGQGAEEPTFHTGCAVERDEGRTGVGLEVGSWARVCAESREEMEGPEAEQRQEVPG